MHIIIAGGGIGGLALALALHQRRIACAVCESVTELRPLGVGINLLPHSVQQLTEAISARYKQMAGFAKEQVKAQP